MLRARLPFQPPLGGNWEYRPAPPLQRPSASERLGHPLSMIALAAAAVVAAAAILWSPGDGSATVASSLTTTTAPVAERAAATPISGSNSETVVSARAATSGSATDTAARQQRAAPVAAATPEPAAAVDLTAVVGAAAFDAEPPAQTAAVAMTSPAERIRAYAGLPASKPMPPSFTYVVEQGDTVSRIAARFGLSEATVQFNNFEIYDPNVLEVGATLRLPPIDGVVYQVQHGDVLDLVLLNYDADLEATLAYAGNQIRNPHEIYYGQTLLLVGGSASVSAAVTPAADWQMPVFHWPVQFNSISDLFGVARSNSFGYHTGVDFLSDKGTLIGASAPGVVSYAGWDNSYGYWVEIDHGGGYRSRYAHLNEILVENGQWVQALDFVGTVGATGNASGTHLHFEIIIGGAPVNPLGQLQ